MKTTSLPTTQMPINMPREGMPERAQFIIEDHPAEISKNHTELTVPRALGENTSAHEKEEKNITYIFASRSSQREDPVEARGSSQIKEPFDSPPQADVEESSIIRTRRSVWGAAWKTIEGAGRSWVNSWKEFFTGSWKKPTVQSVLQGVLDGLSELSMGALQARERQQQRARWEMQRRRHAKIIEERENKIRNFKLRAAAEEMSIWRTQEEIERIKEEHEWENELRHRKIPVSREARLQRIENLRKDREIKEAEAIRKLEIKINQLSDQAKEESFSPPSEIYRKEKLKEAHKWENNRKHHGLSRDPYLQQLQEMQRRLLQEHKEQKGVEGSGPPRSFKNPGKIISDPVNVVTGEFYVHAADLTLNGPMPLEIGRNYSSQVPNSADFGYGWKSTFYPYMHISRDKSVIHAADADGSVIAYIQDPKNLNRWIPTIQENAHLNNIQGDTIGSVGNVFHASIEKTESNSETLYTLQSPTGDKRIFKVRRFTTESGTNERICLEKWEDHRGNYYTFHYGEEGRLSQIRSSNGQSATFTHDSAGRITKISTGENTRSVHYRYDNSGNLAEVTLAEGVSVKYEYEKREITVDHQKHTAHLLVREEKPNGRILKNTYDDFGRVLKQSATMGDNSEPVQNAAFEYKPQSDPDARTITGYTEITDINGQKTKYEYQRSLVTKITDPLGNTIEQEWHTSTKADPGNYPRSLKKSKDKRGLTTQFKYDAKGNLIEKTVRGNLTGEKSDEAALTRYSYNKNNQPTSIVDPLGNEIVIAYENTDYPWLPTRIDRKVQGTLTSSTQNTYYQVSADGTLAKGLLQKVKQATGTADEAITESTHNSQGLITSEKRYTGTNDKHILTQYSYNTSGQLTEETDSSGAIIRHTYTQTGQQSKLEHIDEKGTSQNTTNIKYNKNGEPEQIESSHKDTIRYQYDHAGRPKEEQHFQSQQNHPYHKIGYRHDQFGNLTEILKNGKSIKMTYDKIGQMLTREEAGKETFTYESGGEISTYKNALGGITEKAYTSEGKLRWQKNPDGSIQQWRYQLDGRLAKEILSNGTYWEITYNDIERKITRTLKDSSGQVLITENYHFDHRGNLISYTDAEGHTFRKTYDKLNRLKSEIGPPGTAQAEQRTTSIAYDDKKRTITITNALGEKSILSRDSMGRTISIVIQNASGQKVREKTYAYSANEVTETNGSLITKTLIESLKHSITQADGSRQQISYHPTDRSLTAVNELGERTVFHYDPFERLIKTTRSDGKEIHHASNPAQRQYELILPRGLSWKVNYSKAGQQLTEKLLGEAAYEERKNEDPPGNLTTSERIRSYYENGPHSGKLERTRDARGIEYRITYDNMGRVVQVTSTGSANGVRKFAYDRRGLVTSISQTSDQSQPVHITRTYSPYGDLIEETITLNGQDHQKITQKWDKAGRRIERSFGNFRQEFSYQADGQLIRTRLPNHNKTLEYTYGLDGLLKGKTHANLKQVMNYDNRGRLINRTTQNNNAPFLEEKLAWRANSTISEYQAQYPGTSLQKRSFQYGNRGELISETYPKKTGEDGKISYESPYKTEKDLGVRIGGYLYFVKWLDKWGRPKHIITDDGELRTLYTGKAYPNAKVQIRINGVKFSRGKSEVVPTPSGRHVEFWTIPDIELTPGDYLLSAEAYDPNTLNIVRATQFQPFKVKVQARMVEYEYDPEGNRTKRIVRGTPPSGSPTILRVLRDPQRDPQTRVTALQHINNDKTAEYEWDAWGRLVKVIQKNKDMEGNGYQWSATYDSLGRRLKTVYTPTVKGIPVHERTQTITSYYDPEVEFLEIGVSINNGPPIWKTYGVDKDGTQGGLNGIGGLEAIITPTKSYSVVNDALGHTVAVNDGSQTKKVPIATGAYGPLPGSLKLHLSSDYGPEEVTNWLGKRMDETGLYYMGTRYYDPAIGQFVSADPLGHAGSLDLYSFAHNDPVNFCDPDGRLSKGFNTALSEPDRIRSSHSYTGGRYPEIPPSVTADYPQNLPFQVGLNVGRMAAGAGITLDHPGASYIPVVGPAKDLTQAATGQSFRSRPLSPAERQAALGSAVMNVVPFGIVGKGVAAAGKSSSSILLNSTRQLQSKFKHAADFGVTGPAHKANFARFSSAINQHINSPGVKAIQGTYRNNPVTHYVDPSTGLNVMSDPAGNFISGWKLNPAQLQNVMTRGNL